MLFTVLLVSLRAIGRERDVLFGGHREKGVTGAPSQRLLKFFPMIYWTAVTVKRQDVPSKRLIKGCSKLQVGGCYLAGL